MSESFSRFIDGIRGLLHQGETIVVPTEGRTVPTRDHSEVVVGGKGINVAKYQNLRKQLHGNTLDPEIVKFILCEIPNVPNSEIIATVSTLGAGTTFFELLNNIAYSSNTESAPGKSVPCALGRRIEITRSGNDDSAPIVSLNIHPSRQEVHIQP